MNLSGDCVQRIGAFYQLEPSEFLIVVDDVNLPLGRLRLRKLGSAGGHNGLKSVIQHIGPDFRAVASRRGARRSEVGPGGSRAVAIRARGAGGGRARRSPARADAVEMFVAQGIDMAMNRFNALDDKASVE